MASTTASNLGGAWFSELAAALQGTWQAAAATHEDRPRAPARARARGGDSRSCKAAPVRAAASAKDKQQGGGGDVVRCGGAMSDTTLYMLLDRVAPS